MRGDSLHQELEACLRLLRTLDESGQDLVRFFIKQHIFHDWLTTPTSHMLLINAIAYEGESSSPMTWLSARLLRDLEGINPIITLHFFCSRSRRSVQNITDDTAGMLKVLIFQLLDFVPDPSFLDRGLMGGVEDGTDVVVLFEVLKTMLLQLPSRTYVFLVIDNISLYENRARYEDFGGVVRKLRILIVEEGRDLIIKVLLMCHGRSWARAFDVYDDETLSVPPAFEEDHQGLNELAWGRIMEQSLGELESAATSGIEADG